MSQYRKKRPVRQGQLISPWGVGQMIPFPEGDSLMIAGLDAWQEKYGHPGEEKYFVQELRLEKRLGVKHFRLPPNFIEEERDQAKTVPAIRFPQWHYCKHCGSMEKLSIFSTQLPHCKGLPYDDISCQNTPEKRRLKMIPVRFVVICPDGHIDDFPFMEWVHSKSKMVETPDCRLRYKIRSAGSSLGAIKLICSCGAKSSMHGSFNKGGLKNILKCKGYKPWLGKIEEFDSEPCDKELTVAQKGGSNVYFPNVISSIYIPSEFRPEIHEKYLDEYWSYLTGVLKNDVLDFERFKNVALKNGLDPQEFYDNGLKRYKEATNYDESLTENDIEKEIRKQEYIYLTGNKNIDNDYLTQKTSPIDGYSKLIQSFCNQISLVHRLKETRVFTGFSRLNSNDGKTLSQRKSELSLKKIDWLPAITVSGEGIFLKFKDSLIKTWETNALVKERAEIINNNFANYARQFNLPERTVSPGYIMVHTFSHILINELSLVCGYGSSSLRERIYFNEDQGESYFGLLIYTASGDSEGSLGGLVKQGLPSRLNEMIMSALNKASWCSVDPICIESRGQGLGSCNLAACHNCVLLPETSCEQSNRLLDRAMLIGTLENHEIGFFSNME
ncbi:MAG: DUF1998 domain-containing protein [Candidatus Shapirobacteria bacterium]|nr:DUF1998 domain-containing protein [Candidatus Shapirobacteria bacterium]